MIRLIPIRGNTVAVSTVESLDTLLMIVPSPEMKRLAIIVVRKATLHEIVVNLPAEDKPGKKD